MSIFSIPEGELEDLINIEMKNSMTYHLYGHPNFMKRVRMPLLPYKTRYPIPEFFEYIDSPLYLNGRASTLYREPFERLTSSDTFPLYNMKEVVLTPQDPNIKTQASYLEESNIAIIPGFTFVYCQRKESNSSNKSQDTSWECDTIFSDMEDFEDYEWSPGPVTLSSKSSNSVLPPAQGVVNYNNGFINVTYTADIPSYIEIRAKFAYIDLDSNPAMIFLRQESFSIFPILREASILEAVGLKKYPAFKSNSDKAVPGCGDLIVAVSCLKIFQMYEPERIPEGERLLEKSLHMLNRYKEHISKKQAKVTHPRGV